MHTTGFVAYGIYDEQLAEKVQEFLKFFKSYPLTTVGSISVSNNVISITRKLEDIDDYDYHIFALLEDDKDRRNKKQIADDEKKASAAKCVINAFKDFFEASFPDDSIKKLIYISVKEKGVVCKVYADQASGFCHEDFGYMCKELKANRSKNKSSNLIEFEVEQGVLKKYNGNETNILIPDDVTSIGNSAFEGCVIIRSISMSDNVTNIGKKAFYGCVSLESISLSPSVTKIGDEAFVECAALKSVSIPHGVKTISYSMFASCVALENVSLPKSVKSIDGAAFSNCLALKKIDIPESVKNIVFNVFENGTPMEKIVVHEKNKYFMSIDGNLYSKDGKTLCIYAKGKNQESFAIPEGVETINRDVFYGCRSLETVIIPDSVTTIEAEAFCNCYNLKVVKMGKNVKKIGENAFINCYSLVDIELPDFLERIGATAFYGCSSLTRIKIPASVKYVSYNVFYDCESLTIYLDSETQTDAWSKLWNGDERTVVIK